MSILLVDVLEVFGVDVQVEGVHGPLREVGLEVICHRVLVLLVESLVGHVQEVNVAVLVFSEHSGVLVLLRVLHLLLVWAAAVSVVVQVFWTRVRLHAV